ncbi:MAG: prolipoprotein diacylglyceryl transferase [Synergistetes bacterium]|nr:prolipoprotein diacylglyceryl transferase [Synergistota bacterium]MCX8127418.1 prolipoprotein diacylglyceryl transferase [Synergistota bacterium]MDW8192282.1 prolipoprotein diacylglyceryl transferase [Synergistota bacterium]
MTKFSSTIEIPTDGGRPTVRKLSFYLIPIILFLVTPIALHKVFSGEVIVKPYIFKIGNFDLRWYAILIVTGFILGARIVYNRAPKYGIKARDLDHLLIAGYIAGLVGARLYYVIFNWEYYSKNPFEIIAFWHGGLAIHGVWIGALLTAIVFSGIKKIPFLKLADLGAIAFPLAQSIGRWGNFFNYEAFGTPTDLPWKLFIPRAARPAAYKSFSYFHPTFLYESMWNLFIFIYLLQLEKKNPPPGTLFSRYILLYSIGRLLIENLRTDSLYLGGVRVAQIVSIIFIGIAIYLEISTKKGLYGKG